MPVQLSSVLFKVKTCLFIYTKYFFFVANHFLKKIFIYYIHYSIYYI
jgi:hypothetical protein